MELEELEQEDLEKELLEVGEPPSTSLASNDDALELPEVRKSPHLDFLLSFSHSPSLYALHYHIGAV